MRYALRCVLPLIFVLLLLLAAARPFERVPAGDPNYLELKTLDEAGLLAGMSLPEGELSRLEFAVLVQRALGAYGEGRIAGGDRAAEVEAALSSLLDSFGEELSQLGVKPALPLAAAPAPAGEENLVQRVEAIEQEMDEEEEIANETYSQQTAPEVAGEEEEKGPAIEVTPYGVFNLHGQASNTKLTTGTTIKQSDVNVYWGELGWDVSKEDWSGRFSVLWDDAAEDIEVYEAWVKYRQPENGWFFQVGRLVLPFGNNDYYFPTYPAVNDLGYTTAHTLGTGVERPGWGLSAYAFNPEVEVEGEQDTLSDYSFVWKISEREPGDCSDGWKLRAGYASHLGSSDLRLAGQGPHHERVGAYNIFGRYDWGGNRYHLIADYTAALDRFAAQDYDANGDQQGDRPRALNTEFIYEPRTDSLWGVNYQTTEEMQDYAKTRYGVIWGKRLSDLAMLKLEYTHGVYGAFVTEHQDKDDRFVAELNFNF